MSSKRRAPRAGTAAAQQRHRWYGTQRWKRLRKVVLAGNPLCAICHRQPATQADHVQHRPDNATFWKLENIRPACAECNNSFGAKARHAQRRQTKGQGGYEVTKTEGTATAPGSKITDTTVQKDPSPVDALFQKLKERTPNA